ncbi:DsbC family protein [Geomesophilobacter sediminis]|uniref:DsbC family protein n=1 Tax=Geomesophilobacter sediminis TaxID=2798584 RepID=A0A8J7IMV9_9BACT|nr:DsbC family protein [Geomesophilobacter sediminis]MBJ6724278.1 DsbC family protein [Geomesophilobacter sediminis]
MKTIILAVSSHVERRTSNVFLLLLLLLSVAVPAFGFGKGVEGCSGDCVACHKVSINEVKDIFKGIDPQLSVESVAPSPSRGLYQVTLKKDAQIQVVYLDFSKNFLVGGPLVDLRTRRNVTSEAVEDAAVIDPAEIPLERALVMGNPSGKKVLYLFSDPECPYCAVLHRTLTELIQEEPELKVYLLLVPLEIHPDALWKTESILCSAKSRMDSALTMLQKSYDQKEVPKLECAAGVGAQMKQLGAKLGIAVTPTLALANGKVLRGARGKEEIRKLLNGPS